MRRIALHLGDGWRRHAPERWLEAWTPRTLGLDGGTTEVIDIGSGPPLVLLPPFPGYKEAFVACAGRLAQSHRVVSYDLRASFGAREPWAAIVTDCETLADTLDLGPVTVVGHSLGGAAAQHWALAHPDRVRALVLSSAFAKVTSPRGHWRLRYVEQPLVLAAQRWLPRSLALAHARRLAPRYGWVYDPQCDDAVLELVRQCIRTCSVPDALRRVRLAFSLDTRTRLSAIRCPVLIVTGEHDTAFAREAAGELERLLPHAARHDVPGAGHLHPLSHARAFADRILEWTIQTDRAGAR